MQTAAGHFGRGASFIHAALATGTDVNSVYRTVSIVLWTGLQWPNEQPQEIPCTRGL